MADPPGLSLNEPAPGRSSEAATPDPSAGGRFEVVSRLGAGGMGVIFEARDRKSGQRVALKTLQRMSPDALVRFKYEFRALSDLSHPNLVRLGELIEHDGSWFFTMELIDGCDLLEWVRGRAAHDQVTVTISHTIQQQGSPEPGRADFDERRLRSGMIQLGRGLVALHKAGKVHRDVKPSNVRVTPQGRVVLLDFGLVADPEAAAAISIVGGGTPAYMAPEQASGHPPTPAADWYAAGVMLYELLTGAVPFTSVGARGNAEPVAPGRLVPRIPRDLETICLALLSSDPALRPPGAAVIDALSQRKVERPLTPTRPDKQPLIRPGELDELGAAAAEVRPGRPIAVFVYGPPGSGKTQLVRRFANEQAAAGALVLVARCRERESVPYRAVDGAMDALARHLTDLPPAALAGLLPPELPILARTFPAFARVAAPGEKQRHVPDLRERRADLFRGLRELFNRLGARRPVVLVCDDFQDADEDSLALLRELLAPPDAPPLLFVATRRAAPGESAAGGLRADPLQVISPETRRIVLAGKLTAGSKSAPRAALDERIRGLRDADFQILALLCLAGAPLELRVLSRAGPVGEPDLGRSVGALRAAGLLRHSDERDWHALEPAGEEVRTVVTHILGAGPGHAAELHLRLAIALRESGADAALVSDHFAWAGRAEQSAEHALRAARAAEEALAFDRAALLYRRALELGTMKLRERAAIREKLGDVLAAAGRGGEAAREYLAAAEGSPRSRELERRAADQYLRSGRTELGLALARRVFRGVGLSLPSSSVGAALRYLRHRAELSLRRLRVAPAIAAEASPALLERIDTLDGFSLGIGGVEIVTGAALQFQHLNLALRAGEPRRIARGLSMVAPYLAAAGGARGQVRAARMLQAAARWAADGSDRSFEALHTSTAGFAALQGGRWRTARELAERAEAVYREHCTNVAGEMAVVRVTMLWALFFLGELGELGRRAPLFLRDALERGDVLAATNLRVGAPNAARLIAGDPEAARRDVDEAMAQWRRPGFDAQRVFELLARSQIDCYCGDGAAVHARVNAWWKPLRRSLLLRVQLLRVLALDLRGRAALAAAAGGSRRALVSRAEADARRLAREGSSWPDGHARLLHAGASDIRGDRAAARGHLAAAAAAFADAGMRFHVAACRIRLGELDPGPDDRERAGAAERWLTEQRVADPAAMVRMVTPWWS